jgi:hypothetical protein
MTTFNWGDEGGDVGGALVGLSVATCSNAKTAESTNAVPTVDRNTAYLYASPRMCQCCDSNMVNKTDVQRFEKLGAQLRMVGLGDMYAKEIPKPTRVACRECRKEVSRENAAFQYYKLVARICVGHAAIRDNPNYPEAPYLRNWTRVHMRRANALGTSLAQMVPTTLDCVDMATRFRVETEVMNSPLPSLQYV